MLHVPKEECPSLPPFCPSGFSPSSLLLAITRSLRELGGLLPWRWAFQQDLDEGAQGPEEESAGASRQLLPLRALPEEDPLARKARILVEFLLEKYTKKSHHAEYPDENRPAGSTGSTSLRSSVQPVSTWSWSLAWR